jgi:hypothetical protein
MANKKKSGKNEEMCRLLSAFVLSRSCENDETKFKIIIKKTYIRNVCKINFWKRNVTAREMAHFIKLSQCGRRVNSLTVSCLSMLSTPCCLAGK